MTPEVIATVGIFVAGGIISWAVWMSLQTFDTKKEVALIQQKLELLIEIKSVLEDLKENVKYKRDCINVHPAL